MISEKICRMEKIRMSEDEKIIKEDMEPVITETGLEETMEEYAARLWSKIPADAPWWEKRVVKKAIKKEKQRRKEEAKSTLQNVLEMVAFFAAALCVALIIKNFVGQPIIVDGDSMNNTLKNHEMVWSNKIGYEPERFDVVIVKPYDDKDTLYIKRVIAMPGETIYIDKDDKIHITPAGSEESYVLYDKYGFFSGKINSKMIISPNNPDGSYTLGEDEYFCMGDNRYDSKDSRSLGGFSSEKIKGHAVFRIWPLNKIGNFDEDNK